MKYRRHNKKRDDNELEIVKALEEIPACTVQRLDQPVDLLVGYRGLNYLLEVKNPAGKNRLEDSQIEFMEQWCGLRPAIVTTPDEALKAIGYRAPLSK